MTLEGILPANVVTTLDATFITIFFASLISWAPPATALASLVWVLIRIYETDTIQKLVHKRRNPKHEEDD